MNTQLQTVSVSPKTSLPLVMYKDQPVLTFAMIDRAHERPDGTASRNFRVNRNRFIDGEDYFYVTDSKSLDEIRRSSLGVIKDAANEAMLITESGYLMIVKSLTDDLAWQVQRTLVKTYFRAKQEAKQKTPSLADRLDAAFDQHGLIPRDRMSEIFPDLMTSDDGVLELADAIAEHPHLHVAYYDDRVMPNGSVLPLVRREIKDEIKPVVDQIVNSTLRSLETVKTAAPGLTRPSQSRDEAILEAVLAAIKNEGAQGVTDREINRNPPFKSIGSIAMEKALMQLHGESKIRRKKVEQLGRPRYAWVHWQFV